MDTRKLGGQVAWISGGASGMGAATARLFAEHGARVAVADRQHDAGRRVVDEISAAGGRAVYHGCKVTCEDEVRESIDRAATEFGALGAIVNCAGIVHVKLLHESSAAEWDELMGVNLKSIFFSFKHGWRHLKRERRSYVVNVGSISSFVGQAGTPAYVASKAAVLALTRGIALDYAAEGLRANCVCPGITDTPLLRHHLNSTPDPEATLRGRLRRVPIGVALQPVDIARAILYLSCEDSSGITGTSLVVDGGYLATAEWETPEHTAFMDPP